jgi:imidazole glycerol-phosphate synthase subunit HisH
MQQKKIIILDYGLGNLFSVQHVCRHLGYETIITQDKNEIVNADAVILPGVGAFGDAISNIRKLDIEFPLKEYISSGKPFLGVCLGMQLLFSESEEFGAYKGLDIIKGSIKRFPVLNKEGKRIIVPQIAWNRIHSLHGAVSWSNTPLSPIEEGAYMYFVHSYYAVPQEQTVTLTRTEYEGIDYCSSLKQNNVFATQFHPEKSAEKGIEIYKNWLDNI